MIPRQVTVMGDKVVIKQTVKAIEALESGETEIMGLAFILEDLILIRKDLPAKAKPKVLGHELFHIYLHKIGLDQYLTKEQQEVLCQTFTHAYFELKKQGL